MTALGKQHLIASIHYGERAGPSSCACSCGEAMDAKSPDLLNMAWGRHRKAVGAPIRSFSDTIRDSDGGGFNLRLSPAKAPSEWGRGW